ncbi:Chaperone protein DnaJ [Dictyocoela muelleri]|nr:Chaperone protein DnaJ [Dictyocoela muelleri]
MLIIQFSKIICNTLVNHLRDIEYHLNTGNFEKTESTYESLKKQYTDILDTNESYLFHSKYAQFLYDCGKYHEIIVRYKDNINKSIKNNDFIKEMNILISKAEKCYRLSKNLPENCIYLSEESKFYKSALLNVCKKFLKEKKYKEMNNYLLRLNKYFQYDKQVLIFNIVSNFEMKRYGPGMSYLMKIGDNDNYQTFREINDEFKNSGKKDFKQFVMLADKVYEAYMGSSYVPNIFNHLQIDILGKLVESFCGNEKIEKYARRLAELDPNDKNKKQYVECLVSEDKLNEALKVVKSIGITDKKYVEKMKREINDKINQKRYNNYNKGNKGYHSKGKDYYNYNKGKNYYNYNKGKNYYNKPHSNNKNVDKNDPKGYYKILNVPKNASDQEIKKSWRKLTRKLDVDNHPELSKEELKKMDNELMKVNEAYEVLRDPEKRKQYDSGLFSQNEGNFGGGNVPNVDINDIFEAFFGGSGQEQRFFFNNDGFRGSQRTFFFY